MAKADTQKFDEAARDIDRQKDALLDDISKRLNQQTEREELFTIRWRVIYTALPNQ